MKLVHPVFNRHFIFNEDYFNVIVIENPDYFTKLVTDLNSQIEGYEGKFVLSDEDIISLSKHASLIIDFLHLDLNSRKVKTKIANDLREIAYNQDFYLKTNNLSGEIITYFSQLCDNLTYPLDFDDNVDISGLANALNVHISLSSDNLIEKMLEYIVSYNSLFGETVFILVNFKSYVSSADLEKFYKDMQLNKIKLLLIQNQTREVIEKYERCTVLDNDLCEIYIT